MLSIPEASAFVLEHLFNYYYRYPEKMSPVYREIADEEGLERAVADYISGMSDAYCVSLFKDIYIPQSLVPDARRTIADELRIDN